LFALSRAVEQLPVPLVVGVLSSPEAGKVIAALRLAAPRVNGTNIVDVFRCVSFLFNPN
jgi:hypothetical protein